MWSPSTHPWIPPIQNVNQALSYHPPHIHSKSSYSSPYISPLPPPHFYRPTPNHPHSYAPDVFVWSISTHCLEIKYEYFSSNSFKSMVSGLLIMSTSLKIGWPLPVITTSDHYQWPLPLTTWPLPVTTTSDHCQLPCLKCWIHCRNVKCFASKR